jgi:hypothetical protein
MELKLHITECTGMKLGVGGDGVSFLTSVPNFGLNLQIFEYQQYKYILKGSDDCVQHSDSLGL